MRIPKNSIGISPSGFRVTPIQALIDSRFRNRQGNPVQAYDPNAPFGGLGGVFEPLQDPYFADPTCEEFPQLCDNLGGSGPTPRGGSSTGSGNPYTNDCPPLCGPYVYACTAYCILSRNAIACIKCLDKAYDKCKKCDFDI